jgi:hypothetical protein
VNIKIGKYSLAGEAWNEKVHGLDIKWTRDVAIQKHFRARYPKLRQGDNEITAISFKTARLHANYSNCIAFILDHGNNVPTEGIVLIEQETESGIVVRRFEQAFMTGFGSRQIGVTSLHEYEIIGTEVRKK